MLTHTEINVGQKSLVKLDPGRKGGRGSVIDVDGNAGSKPRGSRAPRSTSIIIIIISFCDVTAEKVTTILYTYYNNNIISFVSFYSGVGESKKKKD